MNIEVQVRLRVNDFEKTRNLIERLAQLGETVEKTDYYFQANFAYGRSELRLRKIGSRTQLGLKVQYVEQGVERNEEYVCAVDNASDLIDIFSRCNIPVIAMKHKISHYYIYDSLQIQLVKIKELGCFLEVEKKCTDTEHAKAEKDIQTFCQRLGISLEEKEDRSYLELLKEQKND